MRDKRRTYETRDSLTSAFITEYDSVKLVNTLIGICATSTFALRTRQCISTLHFLPRHIFSTYSVATNNLAQDLAISLVWFFFNLFKLRARCNSDNNKVNMFLRINYINVSNIANNNICFIFIICMCVYVFYVFYI